MPTTIIDPDRHSQLLQRVFDLPRHGLTPDRARWLLDLDIPEAEQSRIDLLNQKANEGLLTDEERADLEAYVNVADLLAYWQSKARQYLKEGNSGSNRA